MKRLRNIKTHPNQKIVIIEKPRQIEGTYAIYDKDALALACGSLNGSALKL